MLSCATNKRLLLRLGSRSFFDYLAVANKVDKGTTLDEQNKQDEAKNKQNAASAFSWEWTKWYEQNIAEAFPKIMTLRNEYQQYESYASRSSGSANKAINFDEYRNKIADPTFVDKLEIDYHFKKNTLSSIKNMDTLNSWKKQAIDSFKKECEKNGFLLVAPLTEDDKLKNEQKNKVAIECDLKTKELLEEYQKDFEQFDAERMMFDKDTYSMKLAENPQIAENVEDLIAGSPSLQDFNMMPGWLDSTKRQRLVQIQDENKRKIFLERFEAASVIQNGLDSSHS